MLQRRTLPVILISLTIVATLVSSRLFVSLTLASCFLTILYASIVMLYVGMALLTENKPIRFCFSYPVLFFVLWGIHITLHSLMSGESNLIPGYLIICALFYLQGLRIIFMYKCYTEKKIEKILRIRFFLQCLLNFYREICNKLKVNWNNPNKSVMLAINANVLFRAQNKITITVHPQYNQYCFFFSTSNSAF